MKISIPCLAGLSLFATAVPLLGADKSDAVPTGTWQWVLPTNPDGKIPNVTFNLKREGTTLTGTVNKQTPGTEAITNGVVDGSQISFQTARHKKDGKTTTTTYSGKINGRTIKGTITIEVNGKTLGSQEWEAKQIAP